MNFDEMLAARERKKTVKARMPYGYFYKRLIDGKFSNFVEFHDEVADELTFNRCIKADIEATNKITHKAQLHFTPNEDDDNIYAIAVEVGNYQTLEQLLNEDPAAIVKGHFATDLINALLDYTININEQDIYHLCFAPSNILLRKNDNVVRMLLHGSFFTSIDQDVLYEGIEQFVAPEVMKGGPIDGRSDVYALGRFISSIYGTSGVPFELKKIVEKATAEAPADRYENVEELRDSINRIRLLVNTGIKALSAVAIALAIYILFFHTLPEREAVEYVAPVKEPIPDEMVEENLDALLGIGADDDSATIASVVQLQKHKNDSTGVSVAKMRQFNAKAEAIFRKQFTKAADQIISEVYNNNQMNSSETNFASKTKRMTEQLAKKQEELTKISTLSPDRAQSIATQIIDQIMAKKKDLLDKDYMGIKKQKKQLDATENN